MESNEISFFLFKRVKFLKEQLERKWVRFRSVIESFDLFSNKRIELKKNTELGKKKTMRNSQIKKKAKIRRSSAPFRRRGLEK